MQSNNKQIGTLPGDHNNPGGPATKRKNMNKVSSLKRVGPPSKVQEKNLIVDRSRALGYNGTMFINRNYAI